MKPVSLEQFKEFIGNLSPSPDLTYNWKEIRDRLILLVLLTTGCRAEELCLLNNSDVTIQFDRVVHFSITTLKQRGIPPKRFVPVESVQVVRYVHAWYGYRINSAGPFLLSNSGRRLYPKKVFRVVRSFFPGFSPHSLRHHFAIFLLNNSVPLPTIQYLLGHKHLDTTAIYLRYAEIFCVESVWHRFFISDTQSVREYGKSDKIVKISNWRPQ